MIFKGVLWSYATWLVPNHHENWGNTHNQSSISRMGLAFMDIWHPNSKFPVAWEGWGLNLCTPDKLSKMNKLISKSFSAIFDIGYWPQHPCWYLLKCYPKWDVWGSIRGCGYIHTIPYLKQDWWSPRRQGCKPTSLCICRLVNLASLSLEHCSNVS